ncbi:Glycoprotein 3-alpha-L-fucosyltransferase A [Holothuria leucospilota]|uniref:Fucosyltransferase n=1 Tax=Holothuria leucospilota TaxID=206669 RepID=A0A9Q1CA70_HOLLE|nr:Glycoprotein 3-alpha-L-fucosyltransferase A [Holothuria leucospilota]
MRRSKVLARNKFFVLLATVVVFFICSNILILKNGRQDGEEYKRVRRKETIPWKGTEGVQPTDERKRQKQLENLGPPCMQIGVIAGQGQWEAAVPCTRINCTVKSVQALDYTNLTNMDAVYFIQLAHSPLQWRDMLRKRSFGQLWVFNSFESPLNTQHLKLNYLRKSFNWTLTYRTDSTFPSPYGRYRRFDKIGRESLAERAIIDTVNWVEGRHAGAKVMWMASNCRATGWPRTKFVSELQKYIDIDIYGKCGKLSCPKGNDCGDTIRKYKFYLAFENSECTDYITEKFWEPLYFGSIPIVYGPTKADYEKVAPPNSFIHVEDFPKLKDLAKYLLKLDKNDNLFNEYFEWRRHGLVEINLIATYYEPAVTFCRIAEKIHNLRRNEKQQKAENVDLPRWWEASCNERYVLHSMI